MNIDGHHVRIDSIDACTVIHTLVDTVHEGPDKVVRGHFNVIVRGYCLTIRRAKRCDNSKDAINAATTDVIAKLMLLRNPVTCVIP